METEKECYRNHEGVMVYTVDGGSIVEDEKKVCPECYKVCHFNIYPYSVHECETDKLLYNDSMIYCEFGCELASNEGYKPSLDKAALKVEIMGSRARLLDNSIEVYNNSENPYLHGYNCLYIHWQAVVGGYSVFYDYYLEHGYQGRDKEVGKKEMKMQAKAPTSKEAKELLYAWMIERFESDTKGEGK